MSRVLAVVAFVAMLCESGGVGPAPSPSASRLRSSVSSDVRTFPAQVTREPGFQYRDSGGCGQIFVYAWSADRTEVFSVWWDLWTAMGIPSRDKPTWTGVKSFNLKDAPKWLKVGVNLHPSADYSVYCTDVIFGKERRVVWLAVAGTLTLDVGKNMGAAGWPSFPVTVSVTDGVFEAPDGRQARPSLPIVVKTMAGWPVGG